MLVGARLVVALVPIVVLVGCSGPAASRGGAAAQPALPTAPVRLTLPRLGGGTLAIESLRGRPVLITLFTTWSVPCQVEAPSFVRLDERFRKDGLAVVGVALDSQGTTPVKLVGLYVEEMGIRYPVLLAAPDDLDLIGGLGVTRTVPRTLLLDRQGRVVLDQTGPTRFQTFEKKILELLGQRS